MIPDANVHELVHGIEIPQLIPSTYNSSLTKIFAPRPWYDPYNNETILAALEILPDSVLNNLHLTLNIFGISEGDRRRLNALATRASVEMIDGYDFEKRYEYFAEATHVVSMSRSDGIPNAVLEAALAGCSLILGDIEATRQLVRDYGLRAHLVSVEYPTELAHKLEECSLSPNDDVSKAHNQHVIRQSFNSSAARGRISEILRGHLTVGQP